MYPKCGCGRTLHPARLYPLFCACGQKHTAESLSLPNAGQCVHRGDAVGDVDCGCAGKPKAYACAVHGLAMIRKLKPGLVTVEIGSERKRVEMAYCSACEDKSYG